MNRIEGYFEKMSFPALGTRLRPIVAGLTLGIGCLFDAGLVSGAEAATGQSRPSRCGAWTNYNKEGNV
jgi:hypothetical protein